MHIHNTVTPRPTMPPAAELPSPADRMDTPSYKLWVTS